MYHIRQVLWWVRATWVPPHQYPWPPLFYKTVAHHIAETTCNGTGKRT